MADLNLTKSQEELSAAKEAATEKATETLNNKKEAVKQAFDVKSKTGLLKDKLSTMVALPGVDDIKSKVLDEIVPKVVRENVLKLNQMAIDKAKEEALKNAPEVDAATEVLDNAKLLLNSLQSYIDVYKEEAISLQDEFNNYTVGDDTDNKYTTTTTNDDGSTTETTGYSSTWLLNNKVVDGAEEETGYLDDTIKEELKVVKGTSYEMINQYISKQSGYNTEFFKHTTTEGSTTWDHPECQDTNSIPYKFNDTCNKLSDKLSKEEPLESTFIQALVELVKLIEDTNETDNNDDFRTKLAEAQEKKSEIDSLLTLTKCGTQKEEIESFTGYDYSKLLEFQQKFLDETYKINEETLKIIDNAIYNFNTNIDLITAMYKCITDALEQDEAAEKLLNKIDDLTNMLGDPSDAIEETTNEDGTTSIKPIVTIKTFKLQSDGATIKDTYFDKNITITKTPSEIKSVEGSLDNFLIEDNKYLEKDIEKNEVRVVALYARYNKATDDEATAEEDYATAITNLTEKSEKLNQVMENIEAQVKSFDATVIKQAMTDELSGIFSDLGALLTAITTFSGQVSALAVACVNPFAVSEAPAIIMNTLMNAQDLLNKVINILDKCDKIHFDISKFAVVKEVFTIINTVVSIMSTIELMKKPVEKAAKTAMGMVKKLKKLI